MLTGLAPNAKYNYIIEQVGVNVSDVGEYLRNGRAISTFSGGTEWETFHFKIIIPVVESPSATATITGTPDTKKIEKFFLFPASAGSFGTEKGYETPTGRDRKVFRNRRKMFLF